MTEPEAMRTGPPFLYDKDYRNSVRFDYERDKKLIEQIAQAVRQCC